MGFTCNRVVLTLVCLFFKFVGVTQTVYYPANASHVLEATANDLAMLLQRAIAGSSFDARSYVSQPSTGIILGYDTAIADNQYCKLQCNGTDLLQLTAAEDNGLVFGVYQYLEDLGFSFYQPGTIWERTPVLQSAFVQRNGGYSCRFKYKSWFISGGHNRWIMDNNGNYGWDLYYGDNGHNWALYQRRNGMLGGYRFAGHRGDIMDANYVNILQHNPCFVACYNGSRQATSQSVSDINNPAAMQLWGGAIEQKYTAFRNTIYGNTQLYKDEYHSFKYNYGLIGIEVPDGSQWGNSTDNSACGNNNNYPSATDQHFRLANFTAAHIANTYSDKHLQVYAYSNHADIPSPGITIDNKIDIQVVPAAFQNETSAKGLLNRWYSKSKNISEYQYLNIPQWGGETPMFYLSDLKNTVQRVRQKNSQGVLWEASPAKFASLPFLWAANRALVRNIDIDSSFREFCNSMFGPAALPVNSLLHQWSDDNTVTVGDFIQDNKYKIPLYLQMLDNAWQAVQTSSPVYKQRIRELKAYLHYMVLYYDWYFDQRSSTIKTNKAAILCLYLARVNRLQLVNSYFLIQDIAGRYPLNDPFYALYNVDNGIAYQNGQLPLVSDAEIDQNFLDDMAMYSGSVEQYDIKPASFILNKISSANIVAAKKIELTIGYTNSADYANRSEFYIHAPAPSSFDLNYVPHFDDPGTGYINFTVEAVDNPLLIIKDVSLNQTAGPGKLTIILPEAGTYKLSVISKYRSSLSMMINTRGCIFYKNTAFLGNKTENYRSDLSSLPGYFYIPEGMHRLYFSINNPGMAFPTAAEITSAFVFQDNTGKNVEAKLVNNRDSSLFFLDIPGGQDGTFWRVFKMEQYNLAFSNISNIEWYAEPKPCPDEDFSIMIVNKSGQCITRAVSALPANGLTWKLYNEGTWLEYAAVNSIDLPANISPNAIVSLYGHSGCYISRRIGDTDNYLVAKQACMTGAAPLLIPDDSAPVIYPNPSTGKFTIRTGTNHPVSNISIYDGKGEVITNIQVNDQVDLSTYPSGIYFYRLTSGGRQYTGKLIKR